MNDLISRKAAKEEILNWAVRIHNPGNLSTEDTMAVLDNLPMVDAVSVVRCKDCQDWMYEYDNVGLCVVDAPEVDGVERGALEYCSRGERRS